MAIIATADLCLVAGAAAQSNDTGGTNVTRGVGPSKQNPPTDRALLVVKVSTDKPLAIAYAGNGPTVTSAFMNALPAIIALVGSFLVVFLGNRQSQKNTTATLDMAGANAQASINQKANEMEVDRIEKWLSDFFGPFMQLSEENKGIAELLRSRQPDPNFRTLRALLDPEWKKSASQTDLNLIRRIVDTGVQLRTLIREKAGPTSPALSPYLSHAARHFTFLELAELGALTEGTEDFERYVYPRQLDPVLNLERERLEARRDIILSNLAARHPAAEPLVVPPELALDRLGETSAG